MSETADATLGAMLRVPREFVYMDAVKTLLTVFNLSVEKGATFGYAPKRGQKAAEELWEEEGGYVLLPRGLFPEIAQSFDNVFQYKYVYDNPLYFTRPLKVALGKGHKPDRMACELYEFLGRRDNQKEAWDALLATTTDKLLALGCVSGETILGLNRGGKGFQISIADAYQRMYRPQGRRAWDPAIPTYIRADVGGRVGLHRVERLVFSGVKQTFTLLLADGKRLRLTEDHEVLTDAGYRRLNSLSPGDLVLTDGVQVQGRKPRPLYKRLSWYENHPYARYQEKGPGRPGWVLEEHRAVAEATLNGLTFGEYRARCRSGFTQGFRYIDPGAFHVHHKDGNTSNNSAGNLEVLPREEHLGQHQPGYVAFGEGVLVPSRVVSIEPYGQEETYDVVCADPHHNFAANGVIVHNCGKGKTILALMYAAWRGWKTLVIVDTDFIIDQWVSAMQKLFLLRASRVGLVKQKVCRIGAHFTIASAKTLAKRGKDPEFYDQFGLVIFDEVHVASAPTFKGILSQVKGERLGLTATPDRKDGMDSLFKYHLGGLEPCYVDTSREMPCTWYFKETEPTVRKELLDKDLLKRAAEEAEKEKSRKSGYKAQARYQELAKIHCYRKIPRLGKYALQRARFENYAYADEKWFETICSDISRAAGAGRNILVLGGRVEHLGQLTDTLQAHGISAGLAVGEVKGADRLKAFKKQVVLATWQLAYKALDIERLDTLILLFPTSDANFLRQASGRIDDRARTGKKNPVVITYCHGYVPSLDRLTAEMLALLPDIDPSAIIRSVRKGTKK